jgi:HSP20 family protein
MNLIKFNPFAPGKSFFNDFSGDFFNGDIANFIGTDFVASNPTINVVESDDNFKIEVAAPGLEKKDFNLSVEKDQLIIESSKQEEKEIKEEKFTRREFNYTSFKRSFHLPENVDVNKIAGKYENGILNITLPKVEKAKVESTRKIKIS